MKIRSILFFLSICFICCASYAAKRIPSGPSSPQKPKAESRVTEDMAPRIIDFGSEEKSDSDEGLSSGEEYSETESETEEPEKLVVVLNAPSGAGKSSISMALERKPLNGNEWEIIAMDKIGDRQAGIKRNDAEDVRQEKIIKKLVEMVNDSVEDGNNVICDVMFKNDAQVTQFKGGLFKGIRTIMSFIHNPLMQLIQNLERRNKLARASNGDFEERGFNQVMKDFGEFYAESEIDQNLGTLSPDDITQAIQSSEGQLFLQKNQMNAETYLDRALKFAYPIFKIQNQVFLKLRFGQYDLIVPNTTPEDAANDIINYIIH